MSVCSWCGEPETKCPYCHHVHCDEDSCRPPECAQAEERELEQR